jgi:hypothetical protein
MLTRRLPEINPRALVVFNGVFYPEAVARSIARTMDIPVITHEVGLRPLSAFFSHDEATFRRVELPDGARLTGPQQNEVEQVLASRIRGDFSMAGVRFWPRMDGLPKSVRDQGARRKRIVSVFTNVIFDTSQIHANVAFADMFEWLDALADVMEKATDTLFVIRAHPDETRPGKVSQESVRAWYESSRVRARQNVVFIGPGEFTSSYELIRASKLVLVYNSSVGLEAAALGVPVLAAARARYSHLPVAVLPATREAYGRQLEAMLASPEIVGPSGASETARAFLYWELFRASLDLSEFLSPHPQFAGMVTFQEFAPDRLQHSMALTCVANGILQGAPFVLPAGEDGVAMQAGVGI